MVENNKKQRVWRWWFALGAVPPLLVVAWIGVRMWLPTWLLQQVVAEAAARGIVLSDCKLDYQLKQLWTVEQIVLENCQVGASSPVAISGSVRRMFVELEEQKPKALRVDGMALKATGTPDWEQLVQTGAPKDIPSLTLAGGELQWFSEPGATTPTISFSNVTHTPLDDQWSAQLNLLGIAQGNAIFGNQLELELALIAEPKNRLRLEIDALQSLAQLEVDFAELPMDMLEGIVFNRLPEELQGVKVNGKLAFEIPYALNPKTPSGNLHAELIGLNFPVPRELAGLVYAPTATLDGKFKADRSFSKFTVNPLRFKTGQLEMKGRSEFLRNEGSDTLSAELSGPLSCSSIVSAAANVHLNTEAAKVASKISRLALRGSVEIYALLKADLSHLEDATLVKGIGIGCGMAPLQLPDLSGFPAAVLKRLPALAQLPELAGALKGATPELPTLDADSVKLPTLELPKFQLPKLKPLTREKSPTPASSN
jgi:hypothetical protein